MKTSSRPQNILLSILSILSMMLLASPTLALTYYYVDKNNPNASNAGPGTDPNLPYKDIQPCIEARPGNRAGDVILVKPATYYELVLKQARFHTGSLRLAT